MCVQICWENHIGILGCEFNSMNRNVLQPAGRDVTVSLSGRDLIVDTENVGRYITGIDHADWKDTPWIGKGLDVLWFEDFDHASVFDRTESTAKLADVVRRYARTGKKNMLVDVD